MTTTTTHVHFSLASEHNSDLRSMATNCSIMFKVTTSLQLSIFGDYQPTWRSIPTTRLWRSHTERLYIMVASSVTSLFSITVACIRGLRILSIPVSSLQCRYNWRLQLGSICSDYQSNMLSSISTTCLERSGLLPVYNGVTSMEITCTSWYPVSKNS